MKPTLHHQNSYIYLMFNHYIINIYTDIDQATKDLIISYEKIKNIQINTTRSRY